MKSGIRKDILNIIRETIEVLKKGSFQELRKVSNHTIHNASLYQDKDSVSIAVVVFALSKILEVFERGEEVVVKDSLKTLKKAERELKNNHISAYRKTIRSLFKTVSKADKEFGTYLKEVMELAQIKKGSKLYEHGLSIKMAADILGITRWELMDYIGKTNIIEKEKIPFNIVKRMEFARRLFGL